MKLYLLSMLSFFSICLAIEPEPQKISTIYVAYLSQRLAYGETINVLEGLDEEHKKDIEVINELFNLLSFNKYNIILTSTYPVVGWIALRCNSWVKTILTCTASGFISALAQRVLQNKLHRRALKNAIKRNINNLC
jgi:hypothetical protein